MQNRSFSRDQGSSSAPIDDIDEEKLRTLWCGGISEKVDEEILYELFLTAGPLERVTIPKDRETKKQKNFAFIVFQHEESTEYAFNLFNGTELFRQAIRLQNKDTGLGELTSPSLYWISWMQLLQCLFYKGMGGGMGPPSGYNNSRHDRSFDEGRGGRDRDRDRGGHMRSGSAPVGGIQFGGQYGGHQHQPPVWGGGYGQSQQFGQAPYGYGNYNQNMNGGYNNYNMGGEGHRDDRDRSYSRDRDNRGQRRDDRRDYSRDRDRSYDRHRSSRR